MACHAENTRQQNDVSVYFFLVILPLAYIRDTRPEVQNTKHLHPGFEPTRSMKRSGLRRKAHNGGIPGALVRLLGLWHSQNKIPQTVLFCLRNLRDSVTHPMARLRVT